MHSLALALTLTLTHWDEKRIDCCCCCSVCSVTKQQIFFVCLLACFMHTLFFEHARDKFVLKVICCRIYLLIFVLFCFLASELYFQAIECNNEITSRHKSSNYEREEREEWSEFSWQLDGKKCHHCNLIDLSGHWQCQSTWIPPLPTTRSITMASPSPSNILE